MAPNSSNPAANPSYTTVYPMPSPVVTVSNQQHQQAYTTQVPIAQPMPQQWTQNMVVSMPQQSMPVQMAPQADMSAFSMPLPGGNNRCILVPANGCLPTTAYCSPAGMTVQSQTANTVLVPQMVQFPMQVTALPVPTMCSPQVGIPTNHAAMAVPSALPAAHFPTLKEDSDSSGQADSLSPSPPQYIDNVSEEEQMGLMLTCIAATILASTIDSFDQNVVKRDGTDASHNNPTSPGSTASTNGVAVGSAMDISNNGSRTVRTLTVRDTDLIRPCNHNTWAKEGKKRGRLVLRCLQPDCRQLWKTPPGAHTKCEDFFAGYCAKGGDCSQPHIYAAARRDGRNSGERGWLMRGRGNIAAREALLLQGKDPTESLSPPCTDGSVHESAEWEGSLSNEGTSLSEPQGPPELAGFDIDDLADDPPPLMPDDNNVSLGAGY